MGRTDITGEKLLAAVTWDWQDVEQLKLRLIPTVAPGKALRKYQTNAARNKGTGNRAPLNEDEQIESGARQIVNDRIGSLIGSGRLEFNENRTQIRLAERRVVDRNGCCPTCYRPFSEATTELKPQPSSQRAPRQTVIYPSFPSWEQHQQKQMGAL